ncbi:MAG: galactose-1-phosphate uridylyltransferase [Thermodesulfobacteriota bacterium]
MPELRKDPVLGRWVIISTERARRPDEYVLPKEEKKAPKSCPFCPGNEDKTPPEILAYRQDGTPANSPGWNLRVVANKFPALTIHGDVKREAYGIYDKMNGVGAHEVIIETPDHNEEQPDFSLEKMNDVLWAYRERIIDLKKDPRFHYVLIFKNRGYAAGASLQHAHSQVIALPIVPKRALEELAGAKAYYDYRERCVFCDIVRQEIDEQNRLITANERFISICPFASRFPFEITILPRTHSSSFEESNPEEIKSLAAILSDTLKRLDKVLVSPPYNYLLHTAPVRAGNISHYHWHCEIIPTLARVAGFEWGSGFYINPTTPEDAAKYLRENKVGE